MNRTPAARNDGSYQQCSFQADVFHNDLPSLSSYGLRQLALLIIDLLAALIGAYGPM